LDTKVNIVLGLTFIINVIGTLAYCTRVTGIKTGRIAISFSIFNILILISRTANSLQSPLLTSKVESSIRLSTSSGLLIVFRLVLIASTLGCIFGAIAMPTFQKFFSKAVKAFDIYRSLPNLILHSFSKSGIYQFKSCIKAPSKINISQLKKFDDIPKKIIVFNIVATALSSTAVLSSLYAGVLNPSFKMTCFALTAVVSSIATILLYLFIDPSLAIMTDDVMMGKRTALNFNRCIIFMISGRIAGTILAQLLLIPSALIIANLANF
jgi:hypothetical protein